MKYLCESCVNFPCSKDMHMMQSSCPIYSPEPKPTNYDRLREKSVEEMAEFMMQTGTEYSCPPPHYFGETGFCRNEDVEMSCRMCWLDWLKQEVASDSN